MTLRRRVLGLKYRNSAVGRMKLTLPPSGPPVYSKDAVRALPLLGCTGLSTVLYVKVGVILRDRNVLKLPPGPLTKLARSWFAIERKYSCVAGLTAFV